MRFKKVVWLVILVSFILAGNLYASNGDLTVNGTINTSASGIKFSDGSTQTTAKKLVWDYVVSAATTSVTSPTLDGNASGGYEFEFIIENATGLGVYYYMYVNGDYTDTDYWAARVGSPSQNHPILAFDAIGSNCREVFQGNITISPSGYVVWSHISSFVSSSALGTYNAYKIASVPNLTSLRIKADQTNGIGANSRFRLWKKIY